jgi:hypothetical protein
MSPAGAAEATGEVEFDRSDEAIRGQLDLTSAYNCVAGETFKIFRTGEDVHQTTAACAFPGNFNEIPWVDGYFGICGDGRLDHLCSADSWWPFDQMDFYLGVTWRCRNLGFDGPYVIDNAWATCLPQTDGWGWKLAVDASFEDARFENNGALMTVVFDVNLSDSDGNPEQEPMQYKFLISGYGGWERV